MLKKFSLNLNYTILKENCLKYCKFFQKISVNVNIWFKTLCYKRCKKCVIIAETMDGANQINLHLNLFKLIR